MNNAHGTQRIGLSKMLRECQDYSGPLGRSKKEPLAPKRATGTGGSGFDGQMMATEPKDGESTGKSAPAPISIKRRLCGDPIEWLKAVVREADAEAEAEEDQKKQFFPKLELEPYQSADDIWKEILYEITKIYCPDDMLKCLEEQLQLRIYEFCSGDFREAYEPVPSQSKSKGQYGKDQSDLNMFLNAALRMEPGFKKDGTYEELYLRLAHFFRTYLAKVFKDGADGLKGEDLLQFYFKEWEKYKTSSKTLNRISNYLNYCIWKYSETGRRFEVYQLALAQWMLTVFFKFHKEVTKTVLELIQKERDGYTIDSTLVSGVVQSYIELGLVAPFPKPKDHKAGEPNLQFYQNYFESQFLEETMTFYENLATEIFPETSDNDHYENYDGWQTPPPASRLKYTPDEIGQLLMDEQKRLETYVHKSTIPMVMKICKEAFVQQKLDKLFQEFRDDVTKFEASDILDIYEFAGQYDEVMDDLEDTMERFLDFKKLVPVPMELWK